MVIPPLNFSKIITLHSPETAAKPSNQKTMVLSFSSAAVSRAPRQQLNRDSCKSPNTQWKIPSEEKGAGGRGKKRKSEGEKRRRILVISLNFVLTHHPHHTHINVGKFNIGI